jgi:hypothetical protein
MMNGRRFWVAREIIKEEMAGTNHSNEAIGSGQKRI